MFCNKCGAANQDAAEFCSQCGNQLTRGGPPSSQGSPALPQGQPGAASPRDVPNYLVQAAIVTIFCCMPFGIVAIVFAAQVNGKLESGDREGALQASRKAKLWSWVSFGVGLGLMILYGLIMLVAVLLSV